MLERLKCSLFQGTKRYKEMSKKEQKEIRVKSDVKYIEKIPININISIPFVILSNVVVF